MALNPLPAMPLPQLSNVPVQQTPPPMQPIAPAPIIPPAFVAPVQQNFQQAYHTFDDLASQLASGKVQYSAPGDTSIQVDPMQAFDSGTGYGGISGDSLLGGTGTAEAFNYFTGRPETPSNPTGLPLYAGGGVPSTSVMGQIGNGIGGEDPNAPWSNGNSTGFGIPPTMPTSIQNPNYLPYNNGDYSTQVTGQLLTGNRDANGTFADINGDPGFYSPYGTTGQHLAAPSTYDTIAEAPSDYTGTGYTGPGSYVYSNRAPGVPVGGYEY